MKNIIIAILCFGSFCSICCANTGYRPKFDSDYDEEFLANKAIIDANFNKYMNNNGKLTRKYTQFGFYTIRDIIRKNQGSNQKNDVMNVEVNKDFIQRVEEKEPSVFFDKVDFKNRYYRGQWTLTAENSLVRLKSEAKVFSSNHFTTEIGSQKIPINDDKDIFFEGKCSYFFKRSTIKSEINTNYQNMRFAIENNNYLADKQMENIVSMKYQVNF